MAPLRGPSTHSIAPTIGDVPRAPSLSSQRAFAVHLGPVAYSLAWTSIYIFHAICALYCLVAAALFRTTQDTFMTRHFDMNGTILSPRYFPAVAVAHYAVGAIHVCFLVGPPVRAVYRIATDRYHSGPSRTDSVVASRVKNKLKPGMLPEAIEKYVPKVFRHTAQTIHARVFARQGLLGIESQQFDYLLLMREMLECGLQTYQAHQMCQSLPRRGLNRLFVGTLIANCWVTPVLHYLVQDKPLQRLLDRLLDVALDFLAAIGVPVVIVASYWPIYDPVLRDFPAAYWDDKLWDVTIRTESSLVFFGSWVYALSRLVFSLGLLLSLDDIKILLKRRRTAVAAVKALPTVKSNPQISRLGATHGAKALRLGHGILFGFGVVVLSIHLHSELRDRPKACLLEYNPWLTAKPTCAVVEFSCYTNRAFTGDKSDFDSVFEDLNPLQLEQISFRHCPSIAVQPSIRQFRNLASLHFYNSTVREWGADAALTNTTHPKLIYLNFIRTNVTDGSLPDGMLARDFPRSVVAVLFSTTNLHHIPDDLDERWPAGMSLCIEFSPLAQYPLVLARIQAMALMLVGNLITEVPAEAFGVTGQLALGLSGNPITYLPDHVAYTGGVYVVLLHSTNLSAVPTWLYDAVAAGTSYVAAGRTPYCLSSVANTNDVASLSGSSRSSGSGTDSGSDQTEAPSLPIIDCSDPGSDIGLFQESIEVRDSEIW